MWEIEIAIFSLWGRFFSTILTLFYEQRSNCVSSVPAIRTAHNYFYNSDSYVAFECKIHIITCFSDKRLLLFTSIVTATIFVYK